MKPWTLLDQAKAPGGGLLTLHARGDEKVIRIDGHDLMSSRNHHSEEVMAQAGLGGQKRADAHVLIGGLGMGYTLRATLEALPSTARVVVAEIAQPIIDWTRGPLAELAGRPLEDARVSVQRQDVLQVLREAQLPFNAILLDVDNGPSALTVASNQSLYSPRGIETCAKALAPRGRLVVWSAGPDDRYLSRLRAQGLQASVQNVTAHGRRHVLFVATRT